MGGEKPERAVASATVKNWRSADEGHAEYEVEWHTNDGASGTVWRRFREFDGLTQEVGAGADELPGKIFGSKSPRKRSKGLNAVLKAVIRKAPTSAGLHRFLRIPEDEDGLQANVFKVRQQLLSLAKDIQDADMKPPQGWKLCSSKNGMTSCNNSAEGKRGVFGIIKNSSPEILGDILINKLPAVETNIDKIEKVSPVGGLDVVYILMKAMMFMRPRDVVMIVKRTKEEDGTEVIVHLGLNEHPDVPPPSDAGDRKRATQSFGGMVLQPTDAGCFVLIANNLDARVSVPDSYRSTVDDYTTNMIADNFVNLQKLAQQAARQQPKTTNSSSMAAQTSSASAPGTSASKLTNGSSKTSALKSGSDPKSTPSSESGGNGPYIAIASISIVAIALYIAAVHQT